VKDPLEQVDVPVIRPRYWALILAAIIVITTLAFPRAVAIVAVILALPVIIFLHELGHFVTAKRAGMKVTEFFVGFGPRIWSFRRGETEYGLKAIPLGGYCKIIGMTNLDEVPPEDEPRTYRAKNYLPKVVVASAGSAMHFALALVLMFTLLAFDGNRNDASLTTTLDAVSQGDPADRAGLRAGDEVVAIDGVAIDDWDDVRPQLEGRAGDEVDFTIERDGQTLDVPVTLGEHPLAQQDAEFEGVGFAGIQPGIHVPSVGLGEAFVETPRQVWDVGAESMGALVDMFSPSGLSNYLDLLSGDEEADETKRFLSPVGYTQVATDAADEGWAYVVYLLVALNVFVGLFNLFPMLPFDGGHIAIATYEKVASKIRRRPVRVDVAKLLPITGVVVSVLAVIFVTSLFLDVTRPV
jgi:membrane-associated protease RseP (regulator of RpoE activity)